MGGLTSPKGGSTLTSTSNQQVPTYVSTSQQNLLNAGNALLSPYLQQQAYTQAPVNSDQSGSYDLLRYLAQMQFTPRNGGNAGAPANTNAMTLGTGGTAAAMPTGMSQSGAGGFLGGSNGTPGFQMETSGMTNGPSITGPAPAGGFGGTGTGLVSTGGMGAMGSAVPVGNDAVTPNMLAPNTASTYTAATYNPSSYGAQNAASVQLDPNEISALMNPYVKDVVDTTTQNMRRQYGETNAGIGARAASSGAYGGSREAIQRGQLDRSYGDQVAQTTSQLMSAGYSQAQAAALANAQMRQQTELANQNAQNTAGQFNATSQNAAGQFNAGAQNTALGYGAQAQNTRDQFNASQGAAMAQLQEAIRSGDFNRQMQAVQALLSAGNAQQAMVQQNVSTPLQYLQLLAGITPQNYGGTTTSTQPNTAASPLQQLLGGGLSLLGLRTTGVC